LNFEQWLEENQFDLDMGSDTLDLMKEAYNAGVQQAHDIMLTDEYGDMDFVMWKLKNLIKESE